MPAYQLGVIGGGNMAEAILHGVLRKNFLPHSAIIASDPVFRRQQYIAHEVGVSCVADNLTPGSCPRVLLAVKPQVLAKVLDEIASTIGEDATVISIAAGITTSFIDKHLGKRGHIVRVMPNTPMLVACGMSAIAGGPRARQEDLRWTEKLFAASGRTVLVDEKMMDAVTGISGSGPAYFFYLIEAMIAAGVAEGLTSEVATMLATHTCEGAARMLIETREPPEELRARVTSPGGTTQRAVETLDAAKVKEALIEAVRAAAKRSRELGK